MRFSQRLEPGDGPHCRFAFWHCRPLFATRLSLVFAPGRFPEDHPGDPGRERMGMQGSAWKYLGAATSTVATLTITVPAVRLTPLPFATGGFRFAFQSLPAVIYIIETKDALGPGARASCPLSRFERRKRAGCPRSGLVVM